MSVPSVTSLCDLLNKPALIPWANKMGLNGIEIKSHTKQKLLNGTKKHNEIEYFLINGESLDDPDKEQKIINLFKGIKIESIEQTFENEFYKGRVDILFYKNGLKYVGDFKSKFKKPYLEHYLQLIAYKKQFNADRICIIDLSRYEIFELELSNELIYISILENLINIYNLKKQL